MVILNTIFRQARPDAKDTTIKAYSTTLNAFIKKNNLHVDDLNNYTKINDILKDYKITSKKNIITTIIVYLKEMKKDYEQYSELLSNLNSEYIQYLQTQTKSKTQSDNWIEYDTLIKFRNRLLKMIKIQDIKNKTTLNNRQFKILQDALIISVYIDHPIRLDFADMKVITNNQIKKSDTNTNYLITGNKMRFILNVFKNRDHLGSKILNINPILSRLIKLWLKFNTSGYFLVRDDRVTPLNPNNLTKRLQNIFKSEFNKNISASMIRHISISNDRRNDISIENQKIQNNNIINKYLHSPNMNELYAKK